jgi:hypothetical protein
MAEKLQEKENLMTIQRLSITMTKIINGGDYRMEDNIQKYFFLSKRIVQKQKMANRCA